MSQFVVLSPYERAISLSILTATALLLASSPAHAQATSVTITQKSAATVYADYATKSRLRGSYAAFQVTPSGGDVTDMWVRLESFSGPQVSLASGEDGLVHIGSVTSGTAKTAFFYLFAAAATPSSESYKVAVYEGNPTSGGTLIGLRSTVTISVVEDTIQANANKVTGGSVNVGNGPFIGGTVTISVNGTTGTVNSTQGTAHFSPATSESWPADVLELQSTSIAMTKSSTTTTYTNELTITGLSNTYDYVATYVFRIVGPKSTATPVSPTAYIASGSNQHKHTAVDSFGNVPPVPPTSLSAWMAKTSSRTLVTGQTDVTYTIKLYNTGATDITFDQVVDTMPSGAVYVANSSTYDGSSIADPNASNGVLTYNRLFTVPAGSSKSLTLQLTIPATTGTYRNTAYGKIGSTKVYSTISGTDQTFVDVTVSATPAPDLTIIKSHTGTVTAGSASNVPFTIKVGNTGSQATSSTNGTVTVTDVLPTGLSFTSITGTDAGWTCNNSGQTVTCTRSDQLALGASYGDIIINTTAGTSIASTATNTATVSGGGETTISLGNNSASDTFVVAREFDLLISKSHLFNFSVGNDFNNAYSVSVTNLGNTSKGSNIPVAVSDSLPSGFTASSPGSGIDAIGGSGWTCSSTTLTCVRSDALSAFSSYPPITIYVNAASSTGGTSVTNNVTLCGNSSTTSACSSASNINNTESDTTNNTASDATSVLSSTVDIIATVRHTGTWTQGDTGRQFFVDVTNNSGTSASSGTITVTDTLPTGLTYTSASGTNWSCSNSGQIVTCTNSSGIAAGYSLATITLTVSVTSDASSPLTNDVSVSGGGDANTTNNTASDSVTVLSSAPDLTVAVSHVGDFTQLTTEQFTVTVTNSGGVNATSGAVTMTDTLPTGLTPTAATGTGWTCSISGQAVTCSRSDSLAAASSYPSITVSASVAANASTSLTNTVSVSGGGETNTSNDSATDSITVSSGAELAVTISDGGGSFVQGTNGSYTVSVTNNGNASTAGTITATATVSSQLNTPSGSGTNWSCSTSGQVVTCTRSTAIAAGASASFTVTTAVDGAATTPQTASATVSGGGDVDTSNNSASDSTTVLVGGSPVVTTSAASSVGATTATLNGTVNASGNSTTVTFVYGPSSTLASGNTTVNATPNTVTGSSNTGVSVSLTGLASGTTYYFRVSGTNGVGTADGSILSFTTPATPSATTGAASNLGSTTVTLNGTVNAKGDSTTVTFRYGTDSTLATGTNVSASPGIVTGSTNTSITAALTGLSPFTTYYYRVSGTNSVGTTDGTILSFTTTDAPAVTTSAASNLALTSATLNGAINARGSATAVTFTYGTVSDLTGGTTANASPSSVTGGANTGVSLGLTGLTPGTTYYYRVSGTNDVGTTTGSILSFTTTMVDLRVTLSHTGNFTQGQTSGAIYKLTVNNAGTAPSSGAVTATVTVPSGLTPTTTEGTGWTCSISGATVTCTRNDSVAANSSYPDVTITVTVATTAAASVSGSASVTGGGDNDTTNNSSTDATSVDGAPEVRVAMSHTGNFSQGQASGATYKVSVSNAGRGATSGTVTATATIPTGLTPLSATGTGWTCTINGATVTCTRNDALAGGSSYPDIAIVVSVSTTAGPSLTPSVSVAGGGDTDTSNNSASDATTIDGAPELQIAIARNGDIVRPMIGAHYLVTVSNAGRGATSGTVTVTSTAPTGFTPSVGYGEGWSCEVSSTTYTCTTTTAIAGSASATVLNLKGNVLSAASSTFTNTVNVSGGGDVDTSNNSASDTATFNGGPDLQVTISHTGNFTKGQTNATYSIAVSNKGTGPTTEPLTASVTLPAGLTFVSASGTGWTCSASGQVVTCTRSDVLAAGSDYPLATIVVSVSNGAPSSVTTQVSVSGGGDIDTSNNGGSDVTTIANGTDLRIALAHTDNFTQGQTGATYTATLTNAGGASSGTVTVTGTMPDGLTPTAASGSGWTCSVSGATLTCTRADSLAQSGSYPALTFTVDVARTASASLTATATVAGGGDVETGNNSASDETTIGESVARADIGLRLSASPATVRLNDDVSVVLTVTNNGPDDTADVVVGWFLPPGVDPKSATVSQGSYNAATAEWSIGPLATGASATMTLPATLTLAGSPAVVATRISSTAIDPSSANDSAAVMLNPERTTDVGVSLSVSEVYPLVGNNVLIRIRATEFSGEAVNDVVISAGLPSGVSVVSSSASAGTFDATSQRWTIATLPGGASETLDVTAKVDAAGVLPSSARVVRTSILDGNPINDYTTAVMNGVSSTSLYLTKSASRRLLSVGDRVGIITFVANDGPATVQNLVVSDALPSSLAFVSASTRSGTYDSSTGLWSAGAVAPGERRALTIIATVTKEGSITSTARLYSGFDSDPIDADNSASVTLSALPVADIEVTVESPERAIVGRSARYVVRVRNLGPSDATGVTVSAGIPYGLALTSATPSVGTYAAGSGAWTIGPMRNGALASLVFDATVLNSAVVVRAAKTKGDQFDPQIGNNQAAAIPAGANWADVQVDIRLDIDDPKVGEPLLVTTRVRNVGPAAATGVVLQQSMPAGFTLSSAEPSAGTFNATTGEWAIGALPVDAEIVMQMRGTVASSGALVFLAEKKTSAPFDPVTANDQGGAAANAEIADLQVVTTIDKTEPLEGERVTLTVVVTNNTRAAASNVSISSILPVGLRYVRHRTTSGTYDVSTGRWAITTIPQVGPTGNATLEITAVVASRERIDASAALGGLDQVDLVSANNTSSQTVSGSGWSTFQTDLVLQSSVAPQLVQPGDTATYTVTSTNLGPTYTADLTISGATPEQTSLVSLTPSAGGECTAPPAGGRGSFTCEWGDVTRLQSRTVTLVVRVDPAARQGSTVIGRFTTASAIGELYSPNNKTTSAISVAAAAATDLAVSATATADGVTATAIALPVGTRTLVQFAVQNVGGLPLASAKYVIEGVDTTQMSLLGFSTTNGAVSGSTSEGEWTVGAMAPGEAATLNVMVAVTGMRSSALSIMRVDAAPGDLNAFNDVATVIVDGIGDPAWAGRRLGTGNVDGVPGDELIVSGGEAETPFVSVLRPDRQLVRFTGYDRNFAGGAHLATCDVDADGVQEIILGSGPYGGPHVRVMKVGAPQVEEYVGFYAFEREDGAGVSVACTDVDGDGRAEVLASRMGGASEIAVISIGRRSAARLMTIRPYDSSFRGGVRLFALPPAVARATGADFDFLTATGPGRDFEIVAWRVAGGVATRVRTITPAPGYTLGGFVNGADLDRDGKLDLVMTTDAPSESLIGVIGYPTGQVIAAFRPYAGMPVAGVHLAIGQPDIASEPLIFITPAHGPSPGIDVFKLIGGALQRLTRVQVIEQP